jgi:hypothetical protein
MLKVFQPLKLINRKGMLSVITQIDGLMFTFDDGQDGKDLQQNGTGMTTGAVLP